MFAQRFLTGFRKEKRVRQASRFALKARRSDDVTDQVRKMLQAMDQKLILMVRN